MQDVAAIVITIAILDSNSQKLIGSTSLGTTGNALPDSGFTSIPATSATGATLPGAAWQKVLTQTSPAFAAKVNIPSLVASQIRVYQRFFYLVQ